MPISKATKHGVQFESVFAQDACDFGRVVTYGIVHLCICESAFRSVVDLKFWNPVGTRGVEIPGRNWNLDSVMDTSLLCMLMTCMKLHNLCIKCSVLMLVIWLVLLLMCLFLSCSAQQRSQGGDTGNASPPVDRHGHRIRANPRRFFGGGGGSDISSPDPLADGEGPAALPLSKNPTTASVLWAPNFEILATPLVPHVHCENKVH